LHGFSAWSWAVCFVFEAGSLCVAQAGLELTILLPQPPESEQISELRFSGADMVTAPVIPALGRLRQKDSLRPDQLGNGVRPWLLHKQANNESLPSCFCEGMKKTTTTATATPSPSSTVFWSRKAERNWARASSRRSTCSPGPGWPPSTSCSTGPSKRGASTPPTVLTPTQALPAEAVCCAWRQRGLGTQATTLNPYRGVLNALNCG
jgi:hypothetical protein